MLNCDGVYGDCLFANVAGLAEWVKMILTAEKFNRKEGPIIHSLLKNSEALVSV